MQIPTIRAMKIQEPNREFIYRAPKGSISSWVHSHNPWIDRVQDVDEAQPEDIQLECTKAMEWGIANQKHMIYGFAANAGVALPSENLILGFKNQEIDDAVDELEEAGVLHYLNDTVFFGMHSMSCASHDGKPPGKIIPISVWNEIAAQARELGFNTVGLGSQSDDPYEEWEGDVLHGQSLNAISILLNSDSNALMSVDTGLKFLSSAVQGNFFTVSCALPHWLIKAPHSGHKSICHNIDVKMVDLLYNREVVQSTVMKSTNFLKAIKVKGWKDD